METLNKVGTIFSVFVAGQNPPNKTFNLKPMKNQILLLGAFVMALSQQAYSQKNVERPEGQTTTGQALQSEGRVLKRTVAIARFTNETTYAKGIFYQKENDPIANQALDILSTKLASSGKFILLERGEIDKIMEEAAGSDYSKVAADYVIVGSVTEFGRKNQGDVKVFSKSKTQTVQAGVSLRLIDVSTGQIIYSEEGKGEAEVSTKTVMGLGSNADFDASLSDKAISAAMSKLVENIINNCMERPWTSAFLSFDQDAILMAGGASQGIKAGDVFDVYERGKKVKNPQTGMMVELPGKKVAQVEVIMTDGTEPNEYAILSMRNGEVDPAQLEKYTIKEAK